MKKFIKYGRVVDNYMGILTIVFMIVGFIMLLSGSPFYMEAWDISLYLTVYQVLWFVLRVTLETRAIHARGLRIQKIRAALVS